MAYKKGKTVTIRSVMLSLLYGIHVSPYLHIASGQQGLLLHYINFTAFEQFDKSLNTEQKQICYKKFIPLPEASVFIIFQTNWKNLSTGLFFILIKY